MEWDINFYMKKSKKTSIQGKTLFFLIIYNIVIIVLLWICQITILDIYYEKEQIDNMDNIVSELKKTNSNNLVSTLQDVAYQNDVCIVLSDDNGVLGTYNINMNGCLLKSNNSKVRELMYNFTLSDDKFKSYKFVNEDKHISALMYGIKLDDDKYTFIYSNLEDISDFTMIIKKQLMYICFIGIFIAIIISLAPIPAPIISRLFTLLSWFLFIFSYFDIFLLKIDLPASLYITKVPAINIPDNTFIFKFIYSKLKALFINDKIIIDKNALIIYFI